MIYRVSVILLLLLVTGCWGAQFEGPDYFEGTETGGSAGDTTTSGATDGQGGSAGTDANVVTTTDGTPKKTTTDGSTGSTTGAVAGSGGEAGSSADAATGGTGGAGCAPPEDIPISFIPEGLETTGSGCDSLGSVASMTCSEEGCDAVELVHDAELIEDDGPLRLRIAYQPWASRLSMHVACTMTEPLDCDYELGHRYEDQVYYVELRETETGYEVARFYNYKDEDDPDRPGVRQLTMYLTSEDYNDNRCIMVGGTSNAMGEFWSAYVDWVKSLEWEC